MSQPNRWQWNEHEDAALHELQNHHAAILYLRGLRKHMDYDTGLVGVRRRISLRMFVELLEERRDPGSPLPCYVPSIASIRWCLDRLEKVGLIRRMEKTHRLAPMVFELPLATIGIMNKPQQQELQQIATAIDLTNNIDKNSTDQNSYNKEVQQELHQNQKYPACPHKELLALWREAMKGKKVPVPKEGYWEPKRKGYRDLSARWTEGFKRVNSETKLPIYMDKESGIKIATMAGALKWWEGFFNYCAKSTFLTTECRAFDLDWAVNYENFRKIIQGNYIDKQ